MKYPTTRFVFDRKKTATKTNDALIQVEILLCGRKKYISTGVKVYKDQWSMKSHVTNRDDMLTLNERIDAIKGHIDSYIIGLAKSNMPFEWDSFERFLMQQDKAKTTFIDYIERRINERTDISESTKKCQAKIVTSLRKYGKIVGFEQLTKTNISDYYEWLLGRDITKFDMNGKTYTQKIAVSTVWSYMKTLRIYIHDAMMHEMLDRDPSIGIRVKRGDYNQTKWLSEDEIKRVENARLSKGSLARVRDLFIFSCYSGLAFSDLMDFRPEKLEQDGENTFLYGKRIKTGQEYVVLILPKAQEILEKYDYHLPKYTNQQYNKRLKDMAKESGIEKPISSHFARHTFGMLLLNNGVRIEVVAKAMGHSTIRETERVYASILKKTVVSEMSKLK